MKISSPLIIFLVTMSINCFSQNQTDLEQIKQLINKRAYTDALEKANKSINEEGSLELFLIKAEIFITLNQKDSASTALQMCKQYLPARPHKLRNINYYHAYLRYAIKFNEFDDVDRITRLYMADPTGVMRRKIRQYPQFATLIPKMHNMATGYYIHLAYLDAIMHPSRFDAYKNSRLYREEENDYEEWFKNIQYFYLEGKWNRRAYQAIEAASLRDSSAELEAYDNLLAFNQGHIFVDEIEEFTDQQLSAKLDSTEAILKQNFAAGSNDLSLAYLKRILFYQGKDKAKTQEYFIKTAENKFLFYKNTFPQLNYEEQRSAYALDTLFFDYFFQKKLPSLNDNRKSYEDYLYYSSTWKNYLLLSDKSDLFLKKNIKLNNKQAIVDVIRFSEAGEIKYGISVFTKKHQFTEVLSGSLIENKSFKAFKNSIQYKLSIPSGLLSQFFGSTIEKLKDYGIKELIFIPDGIYHLINPGVLYDKASDQYLADLFDIKQRLHVNETHKKVSKLIKNSNTILFGNPRFSQLKALSGNRGASKIQLNEFSQLPGTETEVMEISKLLSKTSKKVQEYTDTIATETQVKSSFFQANILHIATHGFFLTKGSGFQKQLYSGIVLTGDDQNDGILYSHEIRQLPTTNASLVVLSACESSLGEISVGEGIAGLKSSLKSIGTKGMILSYWTVDDQVTSLLMRKLYAYILKNRDYENALKAAIKIVKKQYPAPYYWGAFDYQQ